MSALQTGLLPGDGVPLFAPGKGPTGFPTWRGAPPSDRLVRRDDVSTPAVQSHDLPTMLSTIPTMAIGDLSSVVAMARAPDCVHLQHDVVEACLAVTIPIVALSLAVT